MPKLYNGMTGQELITEINEYSIDSRGKYTEDREDEEGNNVPVFGGEQKIDSNVDIGIEDGDKRNLKVTGDLTIGESLNVGKELNINENINLGGKEQTINNKIIIPEIYINSNQKLQDILNTFNNYLKSNANIVRDNSGKIDENTITVGSLKFCENLGTLSNSNPIITFNKEKTFSINNSFQSSYYTPFDHLNGIYTLFSMNGLGSEYDRCRVYGTCKISLYKDNILIYSKSHEVSVSLNNGGGTYEWGLSFTDNTARNLSGDYILKLEGTLNSVQTHNSEHQVRILWNTNRKIEKPSDVVATSLTANYASRYMEPINF